MSAKLPADAIATEGGDAHDHYGGAGPRLLRPFRPAAADRGKAQDKSASIRKSPVFGTCIPLTSFMASASWRPRSMLYGPAYALACTCLISAAA